MTTWDKVWLLAVLVLAAWWFLVCAPKNRQDQLIGDFFKDLAEDDAESLIF